MVIGVDLDDTITNSSEIFIKYAIKYNKEKSIKYKVDTSKLNQTEAFGWDDNDKKNFYSKYLKKILTETIPNENAKNTLRKIHNNGNKIVIITARSKREIKDMEKLTKLWLDNHKIKYDKLLIDCKDKGQTCLDNKVSVFVDDNINNCVDVYKKLKIPVFLYETRYNKNEEVDGIFRVSNWNDISNKLVIKKPLKYIDVYNKNELPKLNSSMRYIHFYGGTKKYRAYIAPFDISRADFMELYPEYIPEQNKPIYENNGIIVRADPKYPCPGFYIFALKKTYKAFDLLDDITFIRFSYILKKIKEGMRKELDINYAHLLSNEKSDPFVNVHFWLVPVNGTTSPDLLDFNVKEYLEQFDPIIEMDKILDYNKRLKSYIKNIELIKKDNELSKKLEKI